MHSVIVKRRNGDTVPFDGKKIKVAIGKAFNATGVEYNDGVLDDLLEGIVSELIATKDFNGVVLGIEHIQDAVENTLIRFGFINTAKAYIRYRYEHQKQREDKQASDKDAVMFTDVDGNEHKYEDFRRFYRASAFAINKKPGSGDVNVEQLVTELARTCYDGMTAEELDKAIIMAPRSYIETDPVYDDLCAYILGNLIKNEIHSTYQIDRFDPVKALQSYLDCVVNDEKLVDTDLLWYNNTERLAQFFNDDDVREIVFDLSLGMTFLGLQTLYDRYLLRSRKKNTVIEAPWMLFMRVAMALALNEKEEERIYYARSFFSVLVKQLYMTSTPTLFNAGLLRPQLSSCYVGTIGDSIESIYNAFRDCALLSKYSGGIGEDWTYVRSLGAYIAGTNGVSQGTIPFMKVLNDTAVAVNQGGKRRGAICSYLETWHLDIMDFLDLRKNTGDDRRRTHDMNTANWIPDEFMMRVKNDQEWTLFSPDDVADLHDLYGNEFSIRYRQYEQMADNGVITLFKRIPAMQLWRKMLSMLFETGHPWITFKDAFNVRNPQSHYGVIHSSNLCTEIGLVTNHTEIAVCNLGSINLPKFVHIGEDGNVQISTDELVSVVRTAVRMLDNVIDLNYYPVEQARASNMKHRPIGLGIMGLQDVYYEMGVAFDSPKAKEMSDLLMSLIAQTAWYQSANLAKEKGCYESFKGSHWSKGILPCDTHNSLIEYRNGTYGTEFKTTEQKELHYPDLREVVKQGMRNCTLLAIAPTATIANIVGSTPSIEPTYQNLYTKSNLSGEFTVINRYLVRALKDRGLWNEKIISDLKFYNGELSQIDEIPSDIKSIYRTSFDLDPIALVEQAAGRQYWIDQAQSLNLYVCNPSGKLLDSIYMAAWEQGLKSTYYLRTLSRSSVEKSTGNGGELNSVETNTPMMCSVDNPDCEACQ